MKYWTLSLKICHSYLLSQTNL